MLSFKEFLNESDEVKITLKKATSSDRAKGESYVVYDKSTKGIVRYNKKWMDGLKRESAKAVSETNDDWDYASSAFAQDKGISIKSK